jgi:hypothetical protein
VLRAIRAPWVALRPSPSPSPRSLP